MITDLIILRNAIEFSGSVTLRNAVQGITASDITLRHSVMSGISDTLVIRNAISDQPPPMTGTIIITNRILAAAGSAGSGISFGRFHFDKTHGV